MALQEDVHKAMAETMCVNALADVIKALPTDKQVWWLTSLFVSW